MAAQDIVDDGKDAGARLKRAFLFSVLIGSVSDHRVSQFTVLWEVLSLFNVINFK